ncbi:MAG: hypothetical protein JRN35_07840 [Nitrososphaerota archaeon]|nr:hypothetical protein [Nitrososphaerota archaeon]
MYVILTISPNGPLLWGAVSQQVERLLEGRNYVKIFGGAYIVQVSGGADQETLASSISALAQAVRTFRFFITQPLYGGGYQGWLEEETWNSVYQIAQ